MNINYTVLTHKPLPMKKYKNKLIFDIDKIKDDLKSSQDKVFKEFFIKMVEEKNARDLLTF